MVYLSPSSRACCETLLKSIPRRGARCPRGKKAARQPGQSISWHPSSFVSAAVRRNTSLLAGGAGQVAGDPRSIPADGDLGTRCRLIPYCLSQLATDLTYYAAQRQTKVTRDIRSRQLLLFAAKPRLLEATPPPLDLSTPQHATLHLKSKQQ